MSKTDACLCLQQKAALAFRKQVASFIAKNSDREIINRLGVTDGKKQTLFELSKDSSGRMFFYESYGDVRNFPRSYRLKRSGNPIDEDEAEEIDDLTRANKQDSEWIKEQRRRTEEMGAREDRANRRAANRAKKQKQAEDEAATDGPTAGPAPPAEGTRRSSRVAANARRQTARRGAVPNIREDEEEHHVGDFAAGLARGQDDLASLLNGLQGCEIRSELGSGSCIER